MMPVYVMKQHIRRGAEMPIFTSSRVVESSVIGISSLLTSYKNVTSLIIIMESSGVHTHTACIEVGMHIPKL